jgi:hypothetical protein
LTVLAQDHTQERHFVAEYDLLRSILSCYAYKEANRVTQSDLCREHESNDGKKLASH